MRICKILNFVKFLMDYVIYKKFSFSQLKILKINLFIIFYE